MECMGDHHHLPLQRALVVPTEQRHAASPRQSVSACACLLHSHHLYLNFADSLNVARLLPCIHQILPPYNRQNRDPTAMAQHSPQTTNAREYVASDFQETNYPIAKVAGGISRNQFKRKWGCTHIAVDNDGTARRRFVPLQLPLLRGVTYIASLHY
jgi:hypothetical protein